MNALAKTFSRLFRSGKPLPEPEPAYGKARAMTGLQLSDEQRAKAAAYKGSINHISPTLAK